MLDFMNSLPNWVVPAITLVVGAILSELFSNVFKKIRHACKRKNPLMIKVKKSGMPPAWYVTNRLPPSDISASFKYQSDVINNEPYCGFAKIKLEITNTSEEVVYINDISIMKDEILSSFRYRVRTVSQGTCAVTRLFADLDDSRCFFSASLENRHGKNGDYFAQGNRIKILSEETEYVYLVFVCLEHAWSFNCNLEYSIHNSKSVKNSLFGEGFKIIPYLPESLEKDYCAFCENTTPDYPKFDDALFFTESKRSSAETIHEPEKRNSLEYLASII